MKFSLPLNFESRHLLESFLFNHVKSYLFNFEEGEMLIRDLKRKLLVREVEIDRFSQVYHLDEEDEFFIFQRNISIINQIFDFDRITMNIRLCEIGPKIYTNASHINLIIREDHESHEHGKLDFIIQNSILECTTLPRVLDFIRFNGYSEISINAMRTIMSNNTIIDFLHVRLCG